MSKNTTSKFSPYAVINWIADAPLKARQKAVLLALARFMSKRNGHKVWPSQKLLAAKAGMCENTLRTQLEILSDLQLVRFKQVRSNKGSYRYEYTLNLTSEIEVTNPQKLRSIPSELEHEGDITNELDVEGLEVFQTQSVRYAHSCDGKTTTEDRDVEERRLLENFTTHRCREDKNTRLRLYMECGRAFTDADHFHKPKDPSKPLSWNQLKSLRIWFDHLHESGCEVMVFAIKNWSRLYFNVSVKPVGKTPTISALEKYGSKRLLEEYLIHVKERMLSQVEQHAPPIDDDYYLRDDIEAA